MSLARGIPSDQSIAEQLNHQNSRSRGDLLPKAGGFEEDVWYLVPHTAVVKRIS